MMKKSFAVFAVLLLCVALCGCNAEKKSAASPVDYTQASAWAFCATEAEKRADVFLVAPTIFFGDEETFSMPMDDETSREHFVGALNMQLGIFSGELNVFAPYYQQASFSAISSGKYNEVVCDIAYPDVAAAFEEFIGSKNDGRPFVLAGFSQGAKLCELLMENYPQYMDKMIACYLYGYAVTDEMMTAHPQIVPAAGETDTGVVVCINSEAEGISDTFTVPAGTKSICINPLNWKTDATPADAALNAGACFLDYEGTITSEIPAFTGAYIDLSRGTLKLPDVDPAAYQTQLTFLKYGEYHLYEYEFFYRNLQQNVHDRVESWFAR